MRQSFPHGRTKTVTVEVKRKRSFGPGASQPHKLEELTPESDDRHPALTKSERAARLRALEDAKRDDDHRRQSETEAQVRAEEEDRHRAEEEAKRLVEETRVKAEEEARRRARTRRGAAQSRTEAAPPPAHPPAGRLRAVQEEEDTGPREKRPGRPTPAKPTPPRDARNPAAGPAS